MERNLIDLSELIDLSCLSLVFMLLSSMTLFIVVCIIGLIHKSAILPEVVINYGKQYCKKRRMHCSIPLYS